MSKITFSAAVKGAFRVTVLGPHPNAVFVAMLVGSGDEAELDLDAGEYVARVADLSTGTEHQFPVAVNSNLHQVIKVSPEYSTPHATSSWRCVSDTKGDLRSAFSPWAEGMGNTKGRYHLEMKKPDTRWRKFAGKTLTNSRYPECLKIIRPSAWTESPILRLKFNAFDRPSYIYVPMFSGGTRVQCSSGGIVDILPFEQTAAAVVGSLSNAFRHEVAQIIQWASSGNASDPAKSALQSRDDPWLAAAAGLLLVNGGGPKTSVAWQARLATRHAWMADLGIISAWWNALDQPNDEVRCLSSITRSRKLGTIYFWSTFAVADKLLGTLVGGKGSRLFRRTAGIELGRWKALRDNAFRVGASVAWTSRRPS